MKINYIILLVILLNFGLMSGQNTGGGTTEPSYLPNITPPSPEAYKISTYGDTPINEFNGKTAISIPLCNYKAGQLSLSVSVNHDGGGVKVDDLSNLTGSNWTLETGGIITRTVKDLVDEEQGITRIYSDNILGFISQYNKEDGTPEATQLSNMIKDPMIDSEQDEFNYNIPGYSGTFYLDQNFIPVITKQENEVKIVCVGNFRQTHEIIITTPDGIKYFFGGANGCEGTFYRNSAFTSGITSFYLTKILHPISGEILFEYETIPQRTISLSKEQSITIMDNEVQPQIDDFLSSGVECPQSYGVPLEQLITTVKQLRITNAKALKKIYSSLNDESVNFNLELVSSSNLSKILNSIEVKNNQTTTQKINFDYFRQFNNSNEIIRTFLTKIEFNKDLQEANSVTKKYEEYRFEYNHPEELPDRLSNSQDFLGYYNGKANANLLPKIFPFTQLNYSFADRTADFEYSTKGILTKIIYPTGGYTTFEYEAEPAKKRVYRSYSSEENGSIVPGYNVYGDYVSFLPVYQTQTVDVNVNLSSNDVVSNHFCHATLTITDMTPNISPVPSPTEFTVRLGYNNLTRKYPYTFIQNHIYKIEVNNNPSNNNPSCDVELNYWVKLFDGYVRENNYGIRLMRKMDYKDSNDATPLVKRLYYNATPDRLDIAIEDLPDLILPDFQYDPTNPFNEDNRLTIPNFVFGSMVNKLFSFAACGDLGTASVLNDRFYETQAYFKTLSSSASTVYFSGGSRQVYPNVTVSYGGDDFENGGVYKVFDNYVSTSPSVVTPSSERRYNIDFASKDFESKKNNNSSFSGDLLQEITFTKRNGHFYKLKQTINTYELSPLSTWMNLVGKEVCSYSIFSSNAGPNTTLTNLYIGIYETKFYKHQKTTTENTDYFDLVPFDVQDESSYKKIVTNQNNTYGVLHGLPIETTVTTSNDNRILKTKNYYPIDASTFNGLTNDQIHAYSTLVNQNRIASPIQVQQYENNDLLSTQRTLYTSWNNSTQALPEIIQTAKGAQPLEDRAIFIEYDAKGNPTVMSLKDGTKTKYFYNTLNQVVAKVENYSAALNIPAQPNLSNACAFITQYPQAQISVYNYDAITHQIVSIVAPNCKTMYYDYDALHQLKAIRDNDGNIVQEFEHNYKPQN